MAVSECFPSFCLEFEKYYLVLFQITTTLQFPKLTKTL